MSWGWVRARVGRRGAFLAFLAFLDYIYALQAHITKLPSHYHLLLSLGTWAWLWLAAALVCTAGAFMTKDRVPYAVASAIKVGWAVMYCRLWLESFPWAWLNAMFWLVFSLVVFMVSGWSEPVFTDAIDRR